MKDLVAWRLRSRDPRVASVRTRCLQPLAELRRRGFPAELYEPRHADRYAAVVYVSAYDESCILEAESLARRGAQVVLDLCDNHFFHERPDAKLERKLEQLRRMTALADRIVASTSELASVVRDATHATKRIDVVEDAVETTLRPESPFFSFLVRLRARRELEELRRSLARVHRQNRTPLVWFGAQSGPYARCGIGDLERVRDVLHDANREHPLSLTVISNARDEFERVVRDWTLPTFYVDWSPSTFFAAMREHAVAVVPITPSPFTRCKSHHRPVQALHLGLAVVADSIPSYEPLRSVIRLDDWPSGLRHYLEGPAGRARDVATGQALVAQRWSIERIAAQWQDLLSSMLASSPRAT